jgi:hypothetical protein
MGEISTRPPTAAGTSRWALVLGERGFARLAFAKVLPPMGGWNDVLPPTAGWSEGNEAIGVEVGAKTCQNVAADITRNYNPHRDAAF